MKIINKLNHEELRNSNTDMKNKEHISKQFGGCWLLVAGWRLVVGIVVGGWSMAVC